MIRSAADKRTRQFLAGMRVREFHSFERQAQKRLRFLADATRIEDLMANPGSRFEALGGDRAGQHSIRINEKWRICFIFKDGDAYDVEITHYH